MEPLPWGRPGRLGEVPVEAAWGHRRAAKIRKMVLHDLDDLGYPDSRKFPFDQDRTDYVSGKMLAKKHQSNGL